VEAIRAGDLKLARVHAVEIVELLSSAEGPLAGVHLA
jgi:hypothetical protein